MRPIIKLWVFSLYEVLQLFSLAKWFYAKLAYPPVYPFRDWCRLRVYNYEKIPNVPYTKMEVSRFTYFIAKFLWYHFDDDVIPQGADFYVNNHCKGNIGVDMLTTAGWRHIGENSSDVGRVTDPLRAFCCAFRWNAWRNPCYNVNYSLLSNKSAIHLVEEIYSTGTPWDERCRIHRLPDERFRDGWRAFLGKKFNYWRTDKGQNRFTFTYAKELKILTSIICYVYKPFYGSIVCIEIKLGWNPDFNGRMTGTFRLPVGKGA